MASPPDKGQTFTWDDVEAAILKATQDTTARLQEDHNREMDSLRLAMAGVLPALGVPEHGGGPGLKINETWSLAEQEAARMAAQTA
jgi:hypothetical protein